MAEQRHAHMPTKEKRASDWDGTTNKQRGRGGERKKEEKKREREKRKGNVHNV